MSASYEQFRRMKPSEHDLAGQLRFHHPDLRLRKLNNIFSAIKAGDTAFLVDPDSGSVSLYVHIHSEEGVDFSDLPELLQQQAGFPPERWEVLEFRACEPPIDPQGNHGVMVRARSR